MSIHESRRDRSGLTLVEVLVVIAIIGVLAGLLLPAVNGARESSRKSVCNSNLRQIAIASVAADLSLPDDLFVEGHQAGCELVRRKPWHHRHPVPAKVGT